MELVVWILINKFHCIIEGGFVRDWIIRGHEEFPQPIPNDILTLDSRNP